MLDKTLLFKAADAAQGISAAQTAIEDRKRAVEEAKAAVETAKADLVEAKSAYDAVIAEFVASGVPASKVKRNVEEFLRILGDLGYVENAQDEAPTAAETKAPRRKKAEPAAPSAEMVEGVARLTEAGEPGVIMLPVEKDVAQEAPAVEAPAAVVEEAQQADDAETVHADAEEAAPISEPSDEATAVTEPEAVAPDAVEEAATEAEASAEAEVPGAAVDAVSYGIDNSEAFAEVLELIETIASTDREDVSETLVTLLNAADWFSREWEKEPLDVDFYRGILNLQFVNSALEESMADELRSALVVVREAPQSQAIFEWFSASLDTLENGGKPVPFAEFAANRANEPVDEVVVAEEVSAAAAEPAPAVSDDVALVGETVEDIGEINFLEDAAALFAGATVESTVVEAPKTDEPAARPAETRSFRPRFLGSKG